MSCYGYDKEVAKEDAAKECKACGWPLTKDDEPIGSCSYSRPDCDDCGVQPCDGSC